MFSPDLTLKSCILWIFSLFFPPPHLSFLSLHFHCEFIRVCSLVELFLLALCTHHTPNIQQQQQHSKPELQEKSQILSNSQKFSMLKLSCSCSTFYVYFFCSFFRHYHEPLEIRNLFIFHPNEQFWDFFLCFSHTRPPPLCVDYAWNFPIFISKSSALKGGSISCCGEKKNSILSLLVECVVSFMCIDIYNTALLHMKWSAEGGREVEWHDLITIFLICRSADHHWSSSGSQVNEMTSDEVNLSSPETSIFCCSHPPPSPLGDPVSSSFRRNVKSYRHDESSHDWHR